MNWVCLFESVCMCVWVLCIFSAYVCASVCIFVWMYVCVCVRVQTCISSSSINDSNHLSRLGQVLQSFQLHCVLAISVILDCLSLHYYYRTREVFAKDSGQ